MAESFLFALTSPTVFRSKVCPSLLLLLLLLLQALRQLGPGSCRPCWCFQPGFCGHRRGLLRQERGRRLTRGEGERSRLGAPERVLVAPTAGVCLLGAHETPITGGTIVNRAYGKH